MSKPRGHKHDILRVFYKHGGSLSVRRLTRLCWEEGVWTELERDEMAFGTCMRQCESVLRTKDEAGLPLAGPSPEKDGAGCVWVQLSLWDYETARYNLGMRLRQAEQDYATIKAMRDYMELRWGQAPEIPTWEYPEDHPIWWHDGFEEPNEDDDDDPDTNQEF